MKGNDCRIYLKLNQNLQQTAIIIVMQYLIVIVLTILLELNSICPWTENPGFNSSSNLKALKWKFSRDFATSFYISQ